MAEKSSTLMGQNFLCRTKLHLLEIDAVLKQIGKIIVNGAFFSSHLNGMRACQEFAWRDQKG